MTDRWTVRAVVIFLGTAAIFVIAIAGYLAANDRGIPDFLSVTGGAVVGALAGILSRTGTDAPQPVEVVNEAAHPVPTNPLSPIGSSGPHIGNDEA